MEPLLIGLFGAVFFGIGFWAGTLVERKISVGANKIYGTSSDREEYELTDEFLEQKERTRTIN